MSIEASDGDRDWAGYYGVAQYVAKEAARSVFAPLTVVQDVINLGIHLFPTAWCDDADEEKPDSLIVTAQNVEKVVDCFMKKNFYVADEVQGKKELEDLYRGVFTRNMHSYVKLVDQNNARLGTTVNFALCISREPGSPFSPAQMIGATLSRDNPVLRLDVLPSRIINNEQAEQYRQALSQPAKEEIRKFLVAHEFSHCVHNDVFKRIGLRLAFDVRSLLPWITGWPTSASWGRYLLYAIPRSFAFQAVSKLAGVVLSRSQEMQADREAMNGIQTNQGAIDFCKYWIGIGVPPANYDHPPMQTRLQQ